MRKNRPGDLEMIGLDGWTKIPPGEAIVLDIDTKPTPSVEECQRTMHRLRGTVLSDGFTIENNVIQLQLADAFGTADRKVGGEKFAEMEDFLRDEMTGVKRRLEGAKPVIRKILDKAQADGLIQDLAVYRQLRHVCAHRPSWQESVYDPNAGTREGTARGRTVGYKLFIADREYIWEIDAAQIDDWAATLNRAIRGTDSVLRTILKIDETGKPLPTT